MRLDRRRLVAEQRAPGPLDCGGCRCSCRCRTPNTLNPVNPSLFAGKLPYDTQPDLRIEVGRRSEGVVDVPPG